MRPSATRNKSSPCSYVPNGVRLYGISPLKEAHCLKFRSFHFVALWKSALSVVAVQAADTKPVFLYSRYFNAPGESRYLPDGSYQDLLQRWGKNFDVRVNDCLVQWSAQVQ